MNREFKNCTLKLRAKEGHGVDMPFDGKGRLIPKHMWVARVGREGTAKWSHSAYVFFRKPPP